MGICLFCVQGSRGTSPLLPLCPFLAGRMDLHGTPPAFITACTAGANKSSAPARMGIDIIVRTPWSRGLSQSQSQDPQLSFFDARNPKILLVVQAVLEYSVQPYSCTCV